MKYKITKEKLEEEYLIKKKSLRSVVPKGCVIHHRNMIRTDNRPENLLLLPRGIHRKVHFELKNKIR